MNALKKLSHLITKLFVLGISLLLINSVIYAQEKTTVTGKVVDSANDPIPGATILVHGTTHGTISNPDGEFTLSCLATDSLTISFVGYLSENALAYNSPLQVIMIEDIAKLGEVVVIGYGTMRKSDLTGSIASVSSEDLNKGVITTTEQVLQGKVSGLTVIKGSGDPTQGATMRLRGMTSLTASSTPLVVIDGVAGVDINSVSPSDIKSIDVLKDASASAIYGSRGANGVIMITTNRPEQGSKIEYNSYFSFGKPAAFLDILTADEWRAKVEETGVSGAIDYGSDTDYPKEITRSSLSQSHALSYTSGSENGGYRASVGYLKNEGVIKTSELERISGSVNAYTYGLNKKLKLDFGVNTSMDKYTPIDNSIFERTYNLNPTAPIFDTINTDEYFQADGTNTENPIEILQNRNDDQTRKRLLTYAKAQIEIINGLKYNVNTSYTYSSHQGRFYLPKESRWGSSSNGYASRSLNDASNTQLETYLNYEKEFLGLHRINAMAGYSITDEMWEGFNAGRRSFDTDLNTYNNLGGGQYSEANDIDSYKRTARLVSFFGRINYNLSNKYNLTATLRRDGSSKFGENNKWGLFPSFGLSWKISDEDFMSFASSYVNLLKLRGGWGITGSQEAIDPYMSLSTYEAIATSRFYDPNINEWRASYGPSQNTNEDLKWESTSQVNVGVDFAILDKLSGSVEYYNKYTSNLLYSYSVSVPPNLVPQTMLNRGEMSNIGYEVALNWNILDRKDFNWDLNFTFAQNTNKIEKLYDEYNSLPENRGDLHGIRGMSGVFSQTLQEGYAVGTFWGQEVTVNEEGEFININGDPFNILDDSLNTDLGNAQPKFTLGFSTGFTYKGFDFSIATYGMLGQKVLNATKMALYDPSRFPDQNILDSYLSDSLASNSFNSYWIESGSFLRLQSLTLGYTFEIKGLKKLRIYAMAENLFVITNYSGLDPEIKIEGYDAQEGRETGIANPGIDRFDVYPRPQTFTVGLNVTF